MTDWQPPPGPTALRVLSAMVHFSEDGKYARPREFLRELLWISDNKLQAALRRLRTTRAIECLVSGTLGGPSVFRVLNPDDDCGASAVYWSDERDAFLTANYPDMEMEGLESGLNALRGASLSRASIERRAVILRLRRSDAFRHAALSKRKRGAAVRVEARTAPAGKPKPLGDEVLDDLRIRWTSTLESAAVIAIALNEAHGTALSDQQVIWHARKRGWSRTTETPEQRVLAALWAPPERPVDRVVPKPRGSHPAPPGGYRLGMAHEARNTGGGR